MRFPLAFSFSLVNLLAIVVRCMGSLKVQVIILILGEDVNFGHHATAPMYDIAFERSSAMYPGLMGNTTKHVLYQTNVKDCAEAAANMIDLAGKLIDLVQRHDGLTVLLSPGCSLEVMVLADFARELDVLLIASTATETAFMNKQRYPTFMSFGPTGHGAQVPALKVFLEKYSLTTATVLCESPYNYLYAQGYLGMICRTIKTHLSASNHFTIYYEEIDSVRSPHYQAVLTRAKQRSRVILIETREDVVRQVMIAAYLLNMTNGEFVFLYMQPNKLAIHADLMERSNNINTNDHVALLAFKSLIVVQFDNMHWDQSESIFKEVANRSQNRYNYTFSSDEMMNDNSLSAFEATLALFEVLNDLDRGANNSSVDGRTVRKSLLNRTFYLESRNVTISAEAFRLVDIYFMKFDDDTADHQFQITWQYDAIGKVLLTATEIANAWYGKTFPPPNKPLCGYIGDLCPDDSSSKEFTRTLTKAAGGIFGVLLVCLIGAGCALMPRWYQTNHSWWQLHEEILPSKNGGRSNLHSSRLTTKLNVPSSDTFKSFRTNISRPRT